MRAGARLRGFALIMVVWIGCSTVAGCAAATTSTDPVAGTAAVGGSASAAPPAAGSADPTATAGSADPTATAGSADPTATAGSPDPTATAGSADPTATGSEVAMVQEAMDRFNATAGGPVTAQQSVLAGLISPAQSEQQSRCPPVTVTITMEPVYARLAASPLWRPSSGTLPGTIYAVPTLLRIYTGDRITGTDLTDLHLAIDDGRVTLPAVCLR